MIQTKSTHTVSIETIPEEILDQYLLEDKTGIPPVPVIPNIDRAILEAISQDGNSLDMAAWHRCGTVHCLAGWAITLAGDAGKALEDATYAEDAGALIYYASSGFIPDFFTGYDQALADLKARAEGQEEKS